MTGLEEFGKVVQCEVKDNMFHCKITKGFNDSAINASKCYGRVLALAGEKYTLVVKHKVEKDLFHMIVKAKK